ncbi:ribosome-recycling factor, mitochondrial-like isoform X1 [Oncorhynchus keta]|uniref:ribosome-recycling factor, mitochondrial-like isoform X1 n=1 Tax=Oncorhynchus keta TaxID=8018 RepID=UPI0015F8EC23|nr:ribosome-recycling factor, mitochondrial-like isoform X1 [Oncorhynchus keta]
MFLLRFSVSLSFVCLCVTAMSLSQLGLLWLALCRCLVPLLRSSCQLAVSSRVPLLFPNTCHRDIAPTAATCVLLYATKMSKVKAAKGQAAKVNINSSLAEDIISLEEVNEEMAAVLTALKEDFSRNLSIKTSSGALDHIVVHTTDGKFPLNQLGQMSMKPPQLIVVNMTGFPHTAGWAMAAATRALRESSMKLNPEVDRTIIRVLIPKVTREYMRAGQFTIKSKESLRRV